MLYDQALLAEVYAEAFAATGRIEFKRTAVEVADYVLRDLCSPVGGFYTAEDADSEGVEGKFYLWTREELGEVLSPEEAGLAARAYNIEPGGNFAEPGKSRDGRNVLHEDRPMVTGDRGSPPPSEAIAGRIDKIRKQLYVAREKRVRPFKDTKILADWNGLMVAALASVFKVTGDERYLRAAGVAANFVLGKMRASDGRLLHMFADGEARISAFLDDYAFLVRGLIGLYEAGFDRAHLEDALSLTRQAIGLLWDETDGGFFFAAQNPELPARKKEIYDGAVPSGNSVMLMNLLRLARLTGGRDFEEKASKLVEAFSAQVGGHPRMHTEFLQAVGFALGPAREVVVVGKRGGRDTAKLLETLRKAFLPDTVILFKPADEPGTAGALELIAPFTKDMREIDGRAAAYVCTGGACLRPVAAASELLDSLR